MVSVSDLSSVKRFVCGVTVVEEEHVNKGNEETRSIPGGACIIGKPLIDDQNDKVAKEAAHEDDLWNESQVDVQWLVKIPEEKHNIVKSGHIQYKTNT